MPKPAELPRFGSTVAMLDHFAGLLDKMQDAAASAADAARDGALLAELEDLFEALEQASDAALTALETARRAEGEEAGTC